MYLSAFVCLLASFLLTSFFVLLDFVRHRLELERFSFELTRTLVS